VNPSVLEFLVKLLESTPILLFVLAFAVVHYVKRREAEALGEHQRVKDTLLEALEDTTLALKEASGIRALGDEWRARKAEEARRKVRDLVPPGSWSEEEQAWLLPDGTRRTLLEARGGPPKASGSGSPPITIEARGGPDAKPSCALCREPVGTRGWHHHCGVALHRRCRKELGKDCPTPGCS